MQAIFGSPSEAELKAAFAVFDRDGQGTLDGEEFRLMYPLLSGEELPFDQVERIWRQADTSGNNEIEFVEFVWLLRNLQAPPSDDSVAPRYLKTVDELKADRVREAVQRALQQRAARLRLNVDCITRSSQLLQVEKPLVCAQLLLRLQRAELEEAAAVAKSEAAGSKLQGGIRLQGGSIHHKDDRGHGSRPGGGHGGGGDGGMLRGSAQLLERRTQVLLQALSSLALDERPQTLKSMRQALMSLDEELPVTETAAHGIARSRGLHDRADRLQQLIDMLHSPGQQRQATRVVEELMGQVREELELLQAGPAALTRGTEEQLRSLRKRIGKFSQLQLLVQGEQQGSAVQHASQLKAAIRTDADVVLEFATQGVFLHAFVPLRSFGNADELMPESRFSHVWAVSPKAEPRTFQRIPHVCVRDCAWCVCVCVSVCLCVCVCVSSHARRESRASDTHLLAHPLRRASAFHRPSALSAPCHRASSP